MTTARDLQGEYSPAVPSRVIFGRGKTATLREEIAALGGRRVLVLSGRTVAENFSLDVVGNRHYYSGH